MIYKNLEFFNVSELEEAEGFNGVRLQRFPKEIRDSLGSETYKKGRLVAQHSTGCEIRFVTDSKHVRLFLSTVEADGDALVYRGNFFHSKHSLKAGVITPIHLEEPPAFANVKEEALESGHFSSNVWRILFNRYCVVFHGIDTFGHRVRPPEENEVPRIKWLAYGSSITHGSSSQSFENSYVEQAAKRLKVDVMCYGLSGSCYCEKEVADFIATKAQWDLVTLELGVNMRGAFTTEEFEQRVTYMIRTIMENNPEKPVVMISIFSNRSDYPANNDDLYAMRSKEYNEVLRKVYAQFKNPYLFLIDGKDILNDFTALTCDLLHPSAFGHILMGETLSNRLKPLINSLVLPKYDELAIKKAVAEKKEIKFSDSVVWLKDVEIGKGGEKMLKMDIVMPGEQSSKPLPAIVYIHGGGWNHGSKDDHVMKLVGIAKRGYAAAAIQYRLTHEAIFPGQLEDCKLAIRYLRGRAKAYNIDTNRIGVWGNSAGGHLAALLGTTTGMAEFEGNGGWQEYSSEVNAVVNWSGPVDFTTEYSNDYSSVTKLLGVRAFDDPERAARAMPSTYITEKTPAFLIIHGDRDKIVPYTQSITLYEALKDKGVDVTFKLLPGEGHQYVSKEPEEMTMEFFDRELASKNEELEEISLVAFKYGESVFSSKSAFYNDTLNIKLPFAWLFYLIKYKEYNILVDTGISDLDEIKKYGFQLHKFSEPIQLLREYGLKPDEITDVIITHSDFDHIGDIDYYINANIYIQEDELKRNRKKIKNNENVISFIDSTKIHNKFTVKHIGGHTIGSSIVTFKHGGSNYILAGDECYINENIEKQIPTARSYNIAKSREFVEKYNMPNNVVLLCHEPNVVKGEIGYKTIIP